MTDDDDDDNDDRDVNELPTQIDLVVHIGLESLLAEELPTGKAPKLYARMTELLNGASGRKSDG